LNSTNFTKEGGDRGTEVFQVLHRLCRGFPLTEVAAVDQPLPAGDTPVQDPRHFVEQPVGEPAVLFAEETAGQHTMKRPARAPLASARRGNSFDRIMNRVCNRLVHAGRNLRSMVITTGDFRIVFLLIALIPLASAVGFLRLIISPFDGGEVSGYRAVAVAPAKVAE
jgi:hypothetical protein